MNKTRSFIVTLSGFALCCFTLTGCGIATGEISGTVKYKGDPIPSGRITFQSQVDRKESFSGLIENGNYTVKDVPAGPTKVAVESLGVEDPAKALKTVPKGLGMPPPGAVETPRAVKRLPIPAKYGSVELTDLTYDVLKGSQKKDFELN